MCKVMEELNELAVREERKSIIQRMKTLGYGAESIIKILGISEKEFYQLSSPSPAH